MKKIEGWKQFIVRDEKGKIHVERLTTLKGCPLFFDTEDDARNFAVEGETIIEVVMIPMREIHL